MLLPSALGFSPHPPVSVYGTGPYEAIAAFLDVLGSEASLLFLRSSSHFRNMKGFFLLHYPLRLNRSLLSRLFLPFRVPTVLFVRSTGISTCCPSTTPFGLALGPDLPGQISFTPETLDIRPRRFSLLSRYSFRHSLFLKLH